MPHVTSYNLQVTRDLFCSKSRSKYVYLPLLKDLSPEIQEDLWELLL